MLQKSEEESKSHSNGTTHSHPSQHTDPLIEVWRRTASKWDAFDEKVTRPALILTYSYPIPTEIRSNVWFIVSGALDLMRKNRNVYQHLSQRESKSVDVIEKDLKRTFVDKEANLKYEPHLRRVLIAFSNFNPEIGYTQGMNYMAGFVLRQYFENAASVNIDFHPTANRNQQTPQHHEHHHADPANHSHSDPHTPPATKETDEYELVSTPTNEADSNDTDSDLLTFHQNNIELVEEKVFWTFVCIMNKVGTLFSDELPGFHKSVECFRKLLSYHGPAELIQHLNALNVYPIMLSSWYHSLFTYPSMNVNIAKRIWDVFLVEQMDFSIILKISYLIVIRHEQQLQTMDFVEILEFCKSNQCFRFNNKDDHDLIYRASKLQLHETYLKPIRNLKYVEMPKSNVIDGNTGHESKSNDEEHKKQSKAQPLSLPQSSTNAATATATATATNTKCDTIFENGSHNAHYKNLNVSTSSVNSNSSSSSFVKLKPHGAMATTNESSANNNDTQHLSEPLKAATKDNSNVSKSWRSLLTFGYAK